MNVEAGLRTALSLGLAFLWLGFGPFEGGLSFFAGVSAIVCVGNSAGQTISRSLVRERGGGGGEGTEERRGDRVEAELQLKLIRLFEHVVPALILKMLLRLHTMLTFSRLRSVWKRSHPSLAPPRTFFGDNVAPPLPSAGLQKGKVLGNVAVAAYWYWYFCLRHLGTTLTHELHVL